MLCLIRHVNSNTFIKINLLRFEKNINPAYDATTTTPTPCDVWQQRVVVLLRVFRICIYSNNNNNSKKLFLFHQIFKARSMQAFHLVKVRCGNTWTTWSGFFHVERKRSRWHFLCLREKKVTAVFCARIKRVALLCCKNYRLTERFRSNIYILTCLQYSEIGNVLDCVFSDATTKVLWYLSS